MFEQINLNAIIGAEVSPPQNTPAHIFQSAYINPYEKIAPQPIAISIGSSMYKGNRYPTPFGSYGDFSCIVGASKSRKTFFKSMLEAAYLGGNASKYTPSFEAHDTNDKLVISLDTEQSRFHTQRATNRVLEMVGRPCELYKTFALRPYAPKERFEFIDWLIYESEYKGHIGLLSIDGFVDLVTDFNSLEQANGLTEKLLSWTAIPDQKNQMHITGILHKNHGTDKPVGHVGSSILKKAETIVFLEKEGINTSVKCEYSRNKAFENFIFEVSEYDWLPRELSGLPNESIIF
jgi:hypothetical protein